MKVEGTCPNCGSKVGVKSDERLVSMMGDTIKRIIEKDKNAIRCSACDQYVDPPDIQVVDG